MIVANHLCEMQKMNPMPEMNISVKRLLLDTARKGVPFYLQSQHQIASSLDGFVSDWWPNCQHVCAFNSHVSCQLCASSTIFTVHRIGKWKRVKIEHRTKISPLHVNLYSLI